MVRNILAIFIFLMTVAFAGFILIFHRTPGKMTDKVLEPTQNEPSLAVSAKSIVRWGAYTGWLVSQVAEFEKKVGRQMDFLVVFVHWGNEKEFPAELATTAKAKKQTLIIFWEAMDYNNNSATDSRFNYDSILRGNWDKYLAEFAQAVKEYGGAVILIPFEEMNGDWYPWSGTQNGNSAAKHIQAYRYLRKKFAGISNVKFGWSVNSKSEPSVPDNAISDYYPGDEYVDYVGVNGFNFGSPWLTFAEVFSSALKQLEAYPKPIIIFSLACADGQKKADWIKDALTQIESNKKIVGWSWFNENKEEDWRVWSDTASLETFKSKLPPISATAIPD